MDKKGVDIAFPVRINKYLALKGIASRREADELISKGMVHINSRTAVLGDMVQKTDNVSTARTLKKRVFRYFAYNKPRGIVTNSPQGDEKDVASSIRMPGVFPIGRLDKDTSGLLLLTDDRRITDSVLNPQFEHEKEYHVSLNKAVSDGKLRMLERGIKIERYRTKPAKVERIGEKSFSLTLTEGKKHQIRRMCASIGASVTSLKRVRIMHIRLGSLKENTLRPLTEKEVSLLTATYTQSH
ncbi:MAG: pseudouridine synthase [Candidatus Paceibacterota bacterium]